MPRVPPIPESELAELRTDVIGQIENCRHLSVTWWTSPADNAHGTVLEDVEMTEVIDRSSSRVRRRRNDIEFDVDAIGWQIHGDPAGLSRAVLNLLDNAAKWSPPGGTVGLRLRQVDSAHAEWWSPTRPRNRTGGTRFGFRAVLPVDLGPAMPGSGLGLAIVKQVVVKHGGMIRIGETVPGAQPPGTSFYVLLPGTPTGLKYRVPSAPQRNHSSKGDVGAFDRNATAVSSVISVDSQ